MSKPETVAQWWEKFAREAIPPEVPPASRENIKKVFYYAVAKTLTAQRRLGGLDSAGDDFVRATQAWARECVAYIAGTKRRDRW